MRPFLPCLAALALAACGASVSTPAAPADAAADPDVTAPPDVSPTDDVPVPARDVPTVTRDVPTVTRDVPSISDAPAPSSCALAGTWTGWWSWTESGQPEMRAPISMAFEGPGVAGRGLRPGGAIQMGSLSPARDIAFWVRSNPEDVGFAFRGSVTADCDAMSGRYASHFYGGDFALTRQVCPAADRTLALDGAPVEDNLTNAPIANIADCGRGTPVQHHAYAIRLHRPGTVEVSLEGLDASGRDLGVSLRADCDAPETDCAGPGTTLRRALPAGVYRVVVSTTINRWIPYRLRATLAE